jgi:hypothetical protein
MMTNPSLLVATSQNPFADASSVTAVSMIRHVNIHTHVPITLDYGDSTFFAQSVLFDTTFHKFRLLDHVNGSMDVQNMW